LENYFSAKPSVNIIFTYPVLSKRDSFNPEKPGESLTSRLPFLLLSAERGTQGQIKPVVDNKDSFCT
jgi:hypothetical protein